jgi:flagellar motor protein MotB
MSREFDEQRLLDTEREQISRSMRLAFAAISILFLNAGLSATRWCCRDSTNVLFESSIEITTVLSFICLGYCALIGFTMKAPCLCWSTSRRRLWDKLEKLKRELNEIKHSVLDSQLEEDFKGYKSSTLETEIKKMGDKENDLLDNCSKCIESRHRVLQRQARFLIIGIALSIASFSVSAVESVLTDDRKPEQITIDSTFIANWLSPFDHLGNELSDISSAIERLADSNRVSTPPTQTVWPCSTLKVTSDSADSTLQRIAIAVEKLGVSVEKKKQPDPIIPMSSRDILFFLAAGFFLVAIIAYNTTDTQSTQAKSSAWKFLAKIGTLLSLSASLLAIDNFTLSFGDINICTGQKTVETRPTAPSIGFMKIGTIDSFATASTAVLDSSKLESIGILLQNDRWKIHTIRLVGRADKRTLNGRTRSLYESNMNLGRQRALSTRDSLIAWSRRNPPLLADSLFVIDSGGADFLNSPPESLMRRDRAVDIYVLHETILDSLLAKQTHRQ